MPGNLYTKETSPVDTLASETGESKGVENLHKRLSRYAAAHERALGVQTYIKEMSIDNPYFKKEFSGVASSLGSCGELLLFRNYYTVNEVRLHKANFCKNHLLCPLCAIRRASKMTNEYWHRLMIIQASDSEIRPFFVTLTVKNCEDLKECFNHIKQAYTKMVNFRKESIRGRRKFIEMNKALGGVMAYEVKRGKNSGLWHVHIHAVWLCKERPYETLLSKEWQEITGDSFVVDVRPINDVTGFIEVLSYAVKFSTMTIEDNFYAYRFLRKKRLINSFGIFRGVDIPEDLEDEPLEDLPYIEMLYAYVYGSGYRLQRDQDLTRTKIDDQVNEGVPF